MVRHALAAAGLALACGCAGLDPAPSDGWPETSDSRIVSAGAFLQVTGTGKPDPRSLSQTQRRSTSRDGGILDARARLIDYLKRIMLRGQTSVGERAGEDPEWAKRLEDAASGLEVVETKWGDSDDAAVVVRVERAAVRRALGIGE